MKMPAKKKKDKEGKKPGKDMPAFMKGKMSERKGMDEKGGKDGSKVAESKEKMMKKKKGTRRTRNIGRS